MSNDTTPAAHPEYTASACAWLDADGAVRSRKGIVVQCPTVDHAHTTEATVRANITQDPEVGLAWVVTACGPDGFTAMEAAYKSATGLAELLSVYAAGQE